MQFDQIQIELRFGIYFSVIALVLSIATGFIAGIPVGVILIRGIIIAAVFFGIGSAVMFIVKKFVPEIYEALSVKKGPESIEHEIHAEGSEETGAADYSYTEPPEPPEFTEFTQKDFDRYDTTKEPGFDSEPNPAQGKMGKHVVVQEQFKSYEPKIMAQAVRTMMSKDKD